MFHKKTLLTLLVFTLIVGGGLTATYAFGGDKADWQNSKKFNSEHYTAMQEVIELGDYAAWSELVGDKPIMENITEENFDQFILMHELKAEGDIEGAKAIAEELGLWNMHKKGKRGMHKFFQNGGKFIDENGDGICDLMDLDK